MSSVWKKHVESGEAFSAENFVVPGVGLVAQLQLFNPVASTVRVRLRHMHIINTVATAGTLYRFDTPLATLGPPAGMVIENLLPGGPPAIAQMRSATPAAAVGALFWQVNAPASEPAMYPPAGREWGHDLLPGQGIHVDGGAIITISMWQWVEVPL